MIESVADMPDGAIGFRVSGELTDSDYADVLMPALRAASQGGEVRMMLVGTEGFDLGSLKARFEAVRTDPDLDLGHRKDWRRVAIVADANFVLRRSFPLVARVIPVDVRLFGRDEEVAARTWLTG